MPRRGGDLLKRRVASTGPRSGERGEWIYPFLTTATNRASTGPRSGERGEQRARGTPARRRPASTGPRSGERGEADANGDQGVYVVALQRGRARESAERTPPAPRWEVPSGFNGAALGRARRVESFTVQKLGPGAASTGPRSGERGEVARNVELECLGPLQRGRARESAERTEGGGEGERSYRASTGPRSGERGEQAGDRGDGGAGQASTGPRSGERGELVRRVGGATGGGASTGPRSGERGERSSEACPGCRASRFNGAALGRARRAETGSTQRWSAWRLQRGRARESAERPDAPRLPGRSPRFNGAALGRARRGASPRYAPPPLWALQRGRARESAERPRLRPTPRSARRASTGPRSGERGEGFWNNRSVYLSRCFNGAALGRARRDRPRRGVQHGRRLLQRGRARESAESMRSTGVRRT